MHRELLVSNGGTVSAEEGVEQAKVFAEIETALAWMVPSCSAFALRCCRDENRSVFTSELAAISGAGPVRRSEFLAGRAAARTALEKIGYGAVPIPVSTFRNPQWPAGAVGSISHVGGVAAAVVARSRCLSAIGIDVAETGSVTSDIWREVLTGTEIEILKSLPGPQRTCMATVAFCAKEAFYKFQYPQHRQWIDFVEVEVVLAPRNQMWTLHVSPKLGYPKLAGSNWSGHYFVGRDFTVALIYQVARREVG